MNQAAVSVVIPTYKAAGFIRDTLDSVAAQTRPPAEVVVADDCSPDDTIAVVTAWGKTAPFPVRVVRLPRNTGGPATPLNVGVMAARGDLIALLDHDDLMEPDKLERQAAVLAAAPDLGLVFHRCRIVGDPSDGFAAWIRRDVEPFLTSVPKERICTDAYRIKKRVAYEGLVYGNFTLTCSALLFRRSIWHCVGDLKGRQACDYELVRKVAHRWDLGYIDSPLVRWWKHDSTLSNLDGSLIEICKILQEMQPQLLSPAARRQLADSRAAFVFRAAKQLWESGRSLEALTVCGSLLRRRPTLRSARTFTSLSVRAVYGGRTDAL